MLCRQFEDKPKKKPKILEECQTNRECHVKQAMPDSKGRACHAKNIGEEDRDSAREDRATRHGRATSAVVRPDFQCGFSCFFRREIVLARVFFVASCFFFSVHL